MVTTMRVERVLCPSGRKLSADDVYARHGEEMFVLCFASADREAVEGCMRDIVEEIKRALSKSKSDAFRISHDVAEVVFVDSDESPLLDTIANSLRQVRGEAENAARVWREHLLRIASIRYKPVWTPSRKVVALHRAVLDEDKRREFFMEREELDRVRWDFGWESAAESFAFWPYPR